MDDVSIYSRALSESEIAMLYGLVAYYPFNGNANDESGHGYHGTVEGDAVLCPDRHGNPDSAYCFDGDQDYITVPGLEDVYLPQYTLSCWFKANSYPGWVLCKGISGPSYANNFDITINSDGKVVGEHEINGTDAVHVISDTTVKTNIWYHAALMYDGADLKLYINGMLEDVNYNPGGPADIGNCAFDIGANGEHDGFFDGAIDEVNIYDRALSECEIERQYDLIAFYPLNEDPNNPRREIHDDVL